jgi:phosphoglycerol transferase MdoB-like AlkP superfamily enzyme
MNNYKLHLKLLAKRLILLYALYTLSRLFFLLLNLAYFDNLSVWQTICLFFFGLRFDTSAIFYSNVLVILMHLIPGNFKNKAVYQSVIKWQYIIINAYAIFTNLGDAKFFEFEGKRTTADIFSPYWLGNDFLALLPKFLLDYWYVVLVIIVFIYILVKLYPQIDEQDFYTDVMNKSNWLKQSAIALALLACWMIGARGGLQMKPLRIITATDYAAAHDIPLVLNTPFTLMKTIGAKPVNDKKYLKDNELNQFFNPIKQYSAKSDFKKLNVVVIILESFGKEYIGSLNGNEGYTPNLDSIIKKCLVFENAFANGKESIEALPSIFSGIPSLMEKPFIISNFSGNQINSLPSLLKTEGYSTAFFHGGKNGTMGFDFFSKLAGIEKYYGLNEYPDKKDFDGGWGIFDEPYLQYVAKTLSSTSQPFFSSVFTLSSHHPYTIPAKYAGKFPKGKLVNLQSIRYADYALGEFFKTAAKCEWFKNTLFVLTADHTAQSMEPKYGSRAGMYRLPIIYYMPADSTLVGRNTKITQQADIFPSVMQYLGYAKPFVSFGNSVFDDKSTGWAVNFINGTYQFIKNDNSLLFDGNKTLGLYDLTTDTQMLKDVSVGKKNVAETMEKELKAIIQLYGQSMIENKLIIRK